MRNIVDIRASFAVKFGKLAGGLCSFGSGFNPA